MTRQAQIAMIAGFILFSPRAVMAERTPTDVELRASYCIGLLRTFWDQAQLDPGNFPEDSLLLYRQLRERDERILRKFNLYLLPRLHEIDPLQLTIALKSGEEDGNRVVPDTIGCAQSCQDTSSLSIPPSKPKPGAPSRNSSCTMACFISKGLYAIDDQLKLCRAPTWLPF